MALKKQDRLNFNQLIRAAKNDDLALVETRNKKTGAYVAMLVATAPDGAGNILMVPFATMVSAPDNPYEAFLDPTMDKLPRAKKVR